MGQGFGCGAASSPVENIINYPRSQRSSITEDRIKLALQKRKREHNDAQPLTFEKILLKFERMRHHLRLVTHIFNEFSEDGKGINFDGLQKTITKFGGNMTPDEIRDLFAFVDLDDSNSIEVKEFLVTLAIGSVLDLLKFDSSKELKEILAFVVSAYLLFDPSGKGQITRSDIEKMISEQNNSEKSESSRGVKQGGSMLSKQRWDEMDWDQNGNIDFAGGGGEETSKSKRKKPKKNCVYEGIFQKKPRNRDVFSRFVNLFRSDLSWIERKFKLMDNKALDYFEGSVLKGSIDVTNIEVTHIPPELISNKRNVIKLQNGKGENVIVSFESKSKMDNFIQYVEQVSQSWQLHVYLNSIADAIGFPKNQEQKRLCYEIKKDSFLSKFSTLNEESFEKLFYRDYPEMLSRKILNFIWDDKKFADIMFYSISNRKIIVQIDKMNMLKTPNKCSITTDGSLLIEVSSIDKGLDRLGDEIPEILSQGREPYIVGRSIRKNEEIMNKNLNSIALLLSRKENSLVLRVEFAHLRNLISNQQLRAKSNNCLPAVEIGQFGDIFYGQYTAYIIELLKSLDVESLSLFNSQFSGTIAILPGKLENGVSHRCSVAKEGFTFSDEFSNPVVFYPGGTLIIEIGENGILVGTDKLGADMIASLDSSAKQAKTVSLANV